MKIVKNAKIVNTVNAARIVNTVNIARTVNTVNDMRKHIALILCMAIFVVAGAAGAPVFASGTPSTWAQEHVNAAVAIGLVPQNLQSNYSQAITRAGFCALAVAVYEAVAGEITGRTAFIDTDDVNVQKAASESIVLGVGDDRFDPDSQLTREQAAVMLSNLAVAVGQPFPQQGSDFDDNGEIAAWAFDSVGYVQAAGVMSGVGDNKFAPKGPYTIEQSIVTIMRTFNIVLGGDAEIGGGQGSGGNQIGGDANGNQIGDDSNDGQPGGDSKSGGSYGGDSNGNGSNGSGSNAGNSYANPFGGDIRFIRTNGYVSGANYPVITVISSIEELEQYYSEYKDIYNFSSREVPYLGSANGFLDAIEDYTEDYFVDNYLIFVLLEESSGSVRHEIARIEDDGTIVIRRLAPEIGTADMAQWHIIFEFNNSFQPERFSVTLNNTAIPVM